MARTSWSARERKLTIVTVMVILVSVIVSWLGLPLWNRLTQLDQATLVSQKKLARLRELASRKPAIEQAYQAYTPFRSPESDEVIQGTFLDELEQLARAGNLQISLKPRPIQRQGHMSRLGIELEIGATQQALLAFLDQLLTRTSLIELERLRISTTVSKEYPLRATLLVNKVVVHP